MCASEEFIEGVSDAERLTVEANPAFVVWAGKEQTRDRIGDRNQKVLGAIFFCVICGGLCWAGLIFLLAR
jgi:hypothetical protein